MQILLIIPLILLTLTGILAGILKFKTRTALLRFSIFSLAANFIITILIAVLCNSDHALTVCALTDDLNITFQCDTLGKYFSVILSFVWLMAGLSACEYLVHDNAVPRFFAFFLISCGVLTTLCYTGNLFTFYLFFEFLSLCSMALVLHNLTIEAIAGALKYLFYSMGGAFLMLYGLFMFLSDGYSMIFTPGGSLGNIGLTSRQLTASFLMILGLSVKAGMFPFHGWLPSAHPVAPAPASAVLSACITKAGVLGILRVVYYTIGSYALSETWVQTVWLILALTTVFMGSMMAYQENVLKKRLAYSTVSQVSYILFGLALMHPVALLGALMHVAFHSLTKCTLFLNSGAIIQRTGKTLVKQLSGIGKEMPVTMWCFTIAAITLIGIPPTSAFVSKWYLAVGSLDSSIHIFNWLGPVILLISALLTAGYLLTISIKAFFPGKNYDYSTLKRNESSILMTLPICIMSGLAVLFGIWPVPLTAIINQVIAVLF